MGEDPNKRSKHLCVGRGHGAVATAGRRGVVRGRSVGYSFRLTCSLPFVLTVRYNRSNTDERADAAFIQTTIRLSLRKRSKITILENFHDKVLMTQIRICLAGMKRPENLRILRSSNDLLPVRTDVLHVFSRLRSSSPNVSTPPSRWRSSRHACRRRSGRSGPQRSRAPSLCRCEPAAPSGLGGAPSPRCRPFLWLSCGPRRRSKPAGEAGRVGWLSGLSWTGGDPHAYLVFHRDHAGASGAVR